MTILYNTSLLFTIFNYIIYIFYYLVHVLFHYKRLVNLLLNYYLYYTYCDDWYLRSAELSYAIALMTNMIIDHYYIDHINYLFYCLLFVLVLDLTFTFNLWTIYYFYL